MSVGGVNDHSLVNYKLHFCFFLQINVLQAKKKFEILDAVSRYFILLI